MEIPFDKIDELRPSKHQDIYRLNFESKFDYHKAKYLLSRLNVRWTANDTTKTIYFCGKELSKE